MKMFWITLGSEVCCGVHNETNKTVCYLRIGLRLYKFSYEFHYELCDDFANIVQNVCVEM